jgi:hypothetical protein
VIVRLGIIQNDGCRYKRRPLRNCGPFDDPAV